MGRITIIGAGQSGLQLGLGLLDNGYEVTIVSNRTADDIYSGLIMSSQVMFDPSLQKCIKRVQTQNARLHQRVAGRLLPGYQRADKIVRPEYVSVYVLQNNQKVSTQGV